METHISKVAVPDDRTRKTGAAAVASLLEREYGEMLTRLARLRRPESEGPRVAGDSDAAAEEEWRFLNFTYRDHINVRLREIERALERIKDGSYWLCEACEAAIEMTRLEADPTISRCRECQMSLESDFVTQF